MNGGSRSISTPNKLSRVASHLMLACLVGWLEPLAADPPTLKRAINLNGPALEIDGQLWEGDEAAHWKCDGRRLDNPHVPLLPPVRGNFAKMMQTSRWGRDLHLEIEGLPSTAHQLVIYAWEDNAPSKYRLSINDREVLDRFDSGQAGQWHRLGPFPVVPEGGAIRIHAEGGDANFSGIEIWEGDASIPAIPATPLENDETRAEKLAFFESRIRPILVEHCYACHSAVADEVGGHLWLDSVEGWKRGGDLGAPALVPGSPDRSLLVVAVEQTHSQLVMPPDGKLSSTEIADLVRWIAEGAIDPRHEQVDPRKSADNAIDWEQARDFWSLQPVARPESPIVGRPDWVRNEIDRFILAKLESLSLTPTDPAEPLSLLRRAKYDLIGLPPTLEEQDEFLQDPSDQNYSRMLDRWLESPQYGERWGRHWLDVVRYADTAGDNSDFPIPQMYRYRNWVIDAFNRDLPYDQMVREQIAGDLLGGSTLEERQSRLIATGYIANSRRFGSRVDDYPQHLTIEDTLDNLGRTFLATTINCSRCHHHKFDPITTEDYYALYGFFGSTRYPWPGIELDQRQRDLVPLVDHDIVAREMSSRKERQTELDREVSRLEKQLSESSGEEKLRIDQALKQAKEDAKRLSMTELPFEQAYAVQDASRIENARVQVKGDPTKLGPSIERRFLTVLGGHSVNESQPSSGRIELANWIADPKNPLTARVIVNRIWLYHFGKGLVPTPNDFGRQGQRPTHPELLDWLASEMMRMGWSIKAMHRLIMSSSTYRMSSFRTEETQERDPSNEWLSSFPHRRLDAEAIRDTLLELSGRLDKSMGGPHPFPPMKEWNFTQHNPFKAIYDTDRRSVYLMTQRIQRHPYLAIFDGPDASASTGQRMVSTTPLQSLYFLNSAFFHQQCQGIAERLMARFHNHEERVQYLYRSALGRPASPLELETITQSLQQLVGEFRSQGLDSAGAGDQAWQSIVRAILRLNEFLYVD